MTGLASALTFLTRLPLPTRRSSSGRHASSTRQPSLGAAWFPAVGLLVGAVVGGVRLAADTIVAPGPATALAIAAGLLLTGALHEDGLADTADGLGAHVPRERRLEILRDSRIGTFGTLALVVALLLAWSLLSNLDGLDCLRAALVAHVLARWALLPHARALAPARAGGAGAAFRPTTPALVAATATAAAAALLVAGPLAGAVALAAAAAATAAATGIARRALGGFTGDTLGATAKLAELAALVALVAVWGSS